jgi:hypothetical protein
LHLANDLLCFRLGLRKAGLICKPRHRLANCHIVTIKQGVCPSRYWIGKDSDKATKSFKRIAAKDSGRAPKAFKRRRRAPIILPRRLSLRGSGRRGLGSLRTDSRSEGASVVNIARRVSLD